MSHKLLVSGFIREQEKCIVKKHIPSEITSLCIEYYHSNSKLLLITNDTIFITDINEDEETKEDNIVWNASTTNTQKSQYIRGVKPISSYFDNGSSSILHALENSGICCYSNISLPKYVLSATKLTGNHNNNVIFKTGGSLNASTDCIAIIFNEADFMTIKTKGIQFISYTHFISDSVSKII